MRYYHDGIEMYVHVVLSPCLGRAVLYILYAMADLPNGDSRTGGRVYNFILYDMCGEWNMYTAVKYSLDYSNNFIDNNIAHNLDSGII